MNSILFKFMRLYRISKCKMPQRPIPPEAQEETQKVCCLMPLMPLEGFCGPSWTQLAVSAVVINHMV